MFCPQVTLPPLTPPCFSSLFYVAFLTHPRLARTFIHQKQKFIARTSLLAPFPRVSRSIAFRRSSARFTFPEFPRVSV